MEKEALGGKEKRFFEKPKGAKERKTMQTEAFFLNHVRDEQTEDRRFFLHIHDTYELYVFVAGNADYLVEGNIYSLRPGDLMLIRNAESHKAIVKNAAEPYERYVLQIRPEVLLRRGFPEELLRVFTDRELGRRNLFTPSEFPYFSPLQCMQKMHAELEHMAPDEVIESNLRALLTAANVAFERDPHAYAQDRKNVAQDVIEYINDNLAGELSLDSISAAFHMSPSQISRIFRRTTGTSVYDYILSKRLHLAQARIARGEGAVSASQQSGFWDYSSFYRLYKKRFGVSPSEAYKKQTLDVSIPIER